MSSVTAKMIGVVAAMATTIALLELPAAAATPTPITRAAQNPELYDPGARVQPIGALDWQEVPTIHLATQFSSVAVDVERIERVHAGMDLPPLRQRDGTPISGMPYYFFGHDPTTGRYLPEYIALCVDIVHMSYHIEKDSTYFDLARLIPADTAREIIDTINAGIQLGSQVGLDIRLDGTQPLTITTEAAGELLMAGQMKAWFLFARDSLTHPLPYLEPGDFTVTRRVLPGEQNSEPPAAYDLSAATGAIEELVRRYRTAPAFAGQTIALDGTLELTDPEALTGFELVFDPANSTPDALEFVDVRPGRDGRITVEERKPIDGDLTLAFTKEFPHGIGGGEYPHSGVMATENDQTKVLISNADEAAFAVSLTGAAVEEPVIGLPPTGPIDDEFDDDEFDHEDPSVEDPSVEEPTVEDPTVDDPAVDDSTDERPAVDEPTLDADGDAADDRTAPAATVSARDELAATGTPITDGAVTGFVGAGAALLAGLVLLVVRRRRRVS